MYGEIINCESGVFLTDTLALGQTQKLKTDVFASVTLPCLLHQDR